MAFDLLKTLKEKTDKFELKKEETISKEDAVNGLNEVFGGTTPKEIQDLLPDEIKLKKLKIDRTTEPDKTYEIEMEVLKPAPPPPFDSFSNIHEIQSVAFEIKTNQPKE